MMQLQTELIAGTHVGRAEDLHPRPPPSSSSSSSYSHDMSSSFTPTNPRQDRLLSFTEFLVNNLSEWSKSHPLWPPAPPPISLSGSDVFIKGRLPHRTAAISLSLASLISDETALLSGLENIVGCTQPSSKDESDRSVWRLHGELGIAAKNCEMSQACCQSLTKDEVHGPSDDVNIALHQIEGPVECLSTDGYTLGTDSALIFSNHTDKNNVEKTVFAHGTTSKEVKVVETPLRTLPDVCVALKETPHQSFHAHSSFPVPHLPAMTSQVGPQSRNGTSLLPRAEDQVNGLPQLSLKEEPIPEKCPDAFGSALMDDYEEGELPEKLLDDEVLTKERGYLEATSCTAKVSEPVTDDGMNETIGCWLTRSSLGRELTVEHQPVQEADIKIFKRSPNKKQKIESQELVASLKGVADSDRALVICGTTVGKLGPAGGEQVPLLEDIGGNLTMAVEADVGLLTANTESMQETVVPTQTVLVKAKHKRGRSQAGLMRRKLKKKQKKEAKNEAKDEALGVRKFKFKAPTAKKKEKAIETCQFYIKGKCKKGASCTFSHDVMPETKSEICKYFLQRCCLKGDDCPYSHALSSFACKYFHMRGHCHELDGCRFSHEPLTEERRQELAKRIEQEQAREEANMDESRDAMGGIPRPENGWPLHNVEESAAGRRVINELSVDMEKSGHVTAPSTPAGDATSTLSNGPRPGFNRAAFVRDSTEQPLNMAAFDPSAPPARKEGGQVRTPSPGGIASAAGVSGMATATVVQDAKTRTRELLDAALAASQPLVRSKPTSSLEGFSWSDRKNVLSGAFSMAKPSFANTSGGDAKARGTNLLPMISRLEARAAGTGAGGAAVGDQPSKPDVARASNRCNLLDYLLKK